MESVNAIYDGNTVRLLEPVPVKGMYEVEIVFKKPLDEKEQKRQKFLSFFGAGDDDDIKLMQEMIDDRKHSSREGIKHDFS